MKNSQDFEIDLDIEGLQRNRGKSLPKSKENAGGVYRI
jgi:hypothetical protein